MTTGTIAAIHARGARRVRCNRTYDHWEGVQQPRRAVTPRHAVLRAERSEADTNATCAGEGGRGRGGGKAKRQHSSGNGGRKERRSNILVSAAIGAAP